jgi:hypothetical protein
MSAFEVDKTHIDVLVSYALQRQAGDTLYWYYRLNTSTAPGEPVPSHGDYMADMARARREVNDENAGMWGALLVAENKASVNHRYADDELEEPYEFTQYAGTFDPVAVLAALNCYTYQSCEHDGWNDSEANAFCEALQARAICNLPGYDKFHGEVRDARQVGPVFPVRRLRAGR